MRDFEILGGDLRHDDIAGGLTRLKGGAACLVDDEFVVDLLGIAPRTSKLAWAEKKAVPTGPPWRLSRFNRYA